MKDYVVPAEVAKRTEHSEYSDTEAGPSQPSSATVQFRSSSIQFHSSGMADDLAINNSKEENALETQCQNSRSAGDD